MNKVPAVQRVHALEQLVCELERGLERKPKEGTHILYLSRGEGGAGWAGGATAWIHSQRTCARTT